jgi:3-hydroxyacyl-CoA dehydrogenase
VSNICNITGTGNVRPVSAEDLDLKRDIFAGVDVAAAEMTIIATNTSILRVNDIATATNRPEWCCELHFFNPPVKIDLVKVVPGEATADVGHVVEKVTTKHLCENEVLRQEYLGV